MLIGSAPALKTTFVIGHDGTYHMARLLNLADGLKNGQFPVRMGGFAYDGYGGVMSVFYPDTFLYPFALMLLGGASAVYVCNVFSVALNIGAALSMYVAAKRLFEKRWAATGASILYTLASYRVVNVFTRIAFGEALAMIFLPLFLVNLYDVVCGDARRWKGLALSAACIFCSHMITTLFCAVLAAGFCLLHIRKIILQKRLLPLVKTVLVCLLLCLLLPVAAPLMLSFFLGMAVKEAKILPYQELLEGGITSFSSLFLGLVLGCLCEASTILNPTVGIILILGILALAISAVGGIAGGWLMYFVGKKTGKSFNPAVGIAGISCMPTTTKLAQHAVEEENPFAIVIPIAMGCNISGVIVSAIAAGVFVATIGLVL